MKCRPIAERLRLAALAAALLLANGPPLFAAEWQLVFSVREDLQAWTAPTDPAKIETRDYTQTVALGAAYLVVQDERIKKVYAFDRQSFHQVGTGPQPFNLRCPLYGHVGLLEEEAGNRLFQGAGLRAGKTSPMPPLLSRFGIETALRVPLQSAPPDVPEPVIEQMKSPDGLAFHHAGERVVRFVPSATPLPRDYHRRFVNYLAHACALHPKIREAIAQTGALPQELSFVTPEVAGLKTVTLRLVSAASADTDSSLLSSDSTPLIDQRDPFAAIYATVIAAEKSGKRLTKADTLAFVQTAVARKNFLDALLALREYELHTGVELSAETSQHQTAFTRDPACQRYYQGLIQPGQPTKELLEKNLASNAAIDRTRLQKAHMLELQRAGVLEQLGRNAEALVSYGKMLEGNPLHTSTLSDLGLFYARGGQQPKAWFCWEAALRLAPEHPFLQKVKGFGLRFEKSYPDFF